MPILMQIILATFFVSLGSLVGVVTLAVNEKKIREILKLLVALAAGTMLATVFLHLLPEIAESNTEPHEYFRTVMLSFVGFFLIEQILHWRHCHETDCEDHHFGTMNLIGDAVHNFIDGLVIAAAFVVSPSLAIPTTIAMAAHEIPQEIGDFGVLLYSGYSRTKAILANLMVSITAILGGIIGYYLNLYNSSLINLLLPVAAGGFLYIATSDLIPELRKENSANRVILTFVMFIVGIAIIWILGAHE